MVKSPSFPTSPGLKRDWIIHNTMTAPRPIAALLPKVDARKNQCTDVEYYAKLLKPQQILTSLMWFRKQNEDSKRIIILSPIVIQVSLVSSEVYDQIVRMHRLNWLFDNQTYHEANTGTY